MESWVSLVDRLAIDSIGWTLLHSLWQGALICFLMLIAMRLIPSKNPQARYLVASLALILLTIWTAFTYFSMDSTSGQSLFSTSLVFSAQDLGSSSQPIGKGLAHQLHLLFPYLVVGWIIGSAWMSVRTVGGIIQLQRLSNKNRIYLPERWNERFKTIKTKMGISREVLFCLTYSIESPITLGSIRPIIYFPFSLFSGLNEDQIEAILAHELAHIRRQDYLLNIIQSFIESILFFNPFVWIISSIIREEREYCCDSMAVAFQGDPMGYAKMLTELEWKRIKGNTLSMGITGQKKSLLTRIKRIMGKKTNQSNHAGMVMAVLLLTTLGLISWKAINGRSEDVPEVDTSMEILEASTIPVEVESSFAVQFQDTVKRKKNKVKNKEKIQNQEAEIVELKRIIEQQQEELQRNQERLSKERPAMLKEKEELMRHLEQEVRQVREIAQEELQRALEIQRNEIDMQELKNVREITEHELQRVLEMKMHELAEVAELLPRDFEINMDSVHEALRISELALHESMKRVHALNEVEIREQMEQAERQMKEITSERAEVREQLEAARREIQQVEAKFNKFQREIEKELKEEGALGKSESLDSLEIRDGDLQTVNGKEYTGSRAAHYRSLIKEYFGNDAGNFSIRK